MNILILGSNSFAGSHFIHHLLENEYEVTGISRNKQKEKIVYDTEHTNFKFNQLDLNKNN